MAHSHCMEGGTGTRQGPGTEKMGLCTLRSHIALKGNREPGLKQGPGNLAMGSKPIFRVLVPVPLVPIPFRSPFRVV